MIPTDPERLEDQDDDGFEPVRLYEYLLLVIMGIVMWGALVTAASFALSWLGVSDWPLSAIRGLLW